MATKNKYIILALSCFIAINATAEDSNVTKFAIKANAEIGIGNSISTSSAINTLSSKTSLQNYSIDFGWTFWEKQKNRLELSVGVGYSPASVKLDLGTLDYDYSASVSADMDGNTYQRYYELRNLHQKLSYDRFTIPVYLTYAYKCNTWLALHADLGMQLGVKIASKLNEISGDAYSYGRYPQYNDLIIDEPYLNDFGATNLSQTQYGEPDSNNLSFSALIGIGAEFRLSKHFAADLSVRYYPGLTNIYKGEYNNLIFTEDSAPVSYTVVDGQKVQSLTNYLNSYKINQLSIRIGLIYRF